ncbi:YggT family protein [Desulfovibrionales bacterium]
MELLIKNLIAAIAIVVNMALNFYFWIVVVAVILSWVNPDPHNSLMRCLRALTEPVFLLVRRWIPFTFVVGFNLSPVVVLLVIQFLQYFLVNTLMQLSGRS